jgi:hypothetical protein
VNAGPAQVANDNLVAFLIVLSEADVTHDRVIIFVLVDSYQLVGVLGVNNLLSA